MAAGVARVCFRVAFATLCHPGRSASAWGISKAERGKSLRLGKKSWHIKLNTGESNKVWLKHMRQSREVVWTEEVKVAIRNTFHDKIEPKLKSNWRAKNSHSPGRMWQTHYNLIPPSFLFATLQCFTFIQVSLRRRVKAPSHLQNLNLWGYQRLGLYTFIAKASEALCMLILNLSISSSVINWNTVWAQSCLLGT